MSDGEELGSAIPVDSAALAAPIRHATAAQVEPADRWRALGCPYEAALALADAEEEAPLRQALEELERLGARPLAAAVARRLRELGVRGLARGPRPATRANPANLTARELEVLGLLVEGRSNRQIAEQLFISGKTASVHVTNQLAKLGVHSRLEAAATARRLGLDQPAPQS